MRADRIEALDRPLSLRTLKALTWFLTAFALGSGAVPARSEPATVRGAGASICSDYAQVYDAFTSTERADDGQVARFARANTLQYEEWVDGFILGMETSFKGVTPRRDLDRIDIGKWISGYCHEH